MITHFPTNPLLNMGGISSFLYVPSYQVTVLPSISGKLVKTALQFTAGSSLLNGYSTLEELEFKETPKSDMPGTYYQWEITGFVPGSSDLLIGLMEDMELVRHLVILKDNNNQQRLVGYDAPLDFTSIFQSGGKPAEPRGFKFTFSGSGPNRAPIYRLG